MKLVEIFRSLLPKPALEEKKHRSVARRRLVAYGINIQDGVLRPVSDADLHNQEQGQTLPPN
jgi:hypothetical protein